MLTGLIFFVWLIVSLCTGYLWLIAIAGIRTSSGKLTRNSIGAIHKRFAIAIPAHNEENVIETTVSTLRQQEYPEEGFTIFVVADNCSDRTAEHARKAGAQCYERTSTDRSGKGAALRWLFEKIFSVDDYDAVVVFDADTLVNRGFLKEMDRRLAHGARVIQGRHVISNPRAGWFPALTWAMMTIDCRLFSQGRSNLGWSARHMGDSICFEAQILKEMGWGSGLTEDYEFRLQLLQAGICIQYEPLALGYGQAPENLQDAQSQRLRWARGVTGSARAFRWKLLVKGFKQKDWRLIDGVLSITLPSFSALIVLSCVMLLFNLFIISDRAPWLPWAWLGTIIVLFLYPFFGLVLEKAPGWAFLVILTGPVFIVWRFWIHLLARLRNKNKTWVRTPHRS